MSFHPDAIAGPLEGPPVRRNVVFRDRDVLAGLVVPLLEDGMLFFIFTLDGLQLQGAQGRVGRVVDDGERGRVRGQES